jgi:hypothetical protein
MSWEQRFRDMILAGGAGALAIVGCSDNSSGTTGPGIGCCNASSDPCCLSLYCGAPQSAACTQKMACEADGGTWQYGIGGCSTGQEDAGPGDATTNGDASGCCNASPDPCCPSLYCGQPVTPDCRVKMTCEAEGGTWSNWSYSCLVPSDAGPDGDAASDAPSDAGPDVNTD